MNMDQLKNIVSQLLAVLTPIITLTVSAKLLTPDQADALTKQLPVLAGLVMGAIGSIAVIWKAMHGEEVKMQAKVEIAKATAANDISQEGHAALMKAVGIK